MWASPAASVHSLLAEWNVESTVKTHQRTFPVRGCGDLFMSLSVAFVWNIYTTFIHTLGHLFILAQGADSQENSFVRRDDRA